MELVGKYVCLVFCLNCYLQNISSFFLLVYGLPSHIKGTSFHSDVGKPLHTWICRHTEEFGVGHRLDKIQVSLQNCHFAEPAPIKDQGVCPCSYMMLLS